MDGFQDQAKDIGLRLRLSATAHRFQQAASGTDPQPTLKRVWSRQAALDRLRIFCGSLADLLRTFGGLALRPRARAEACTGGSYGMIARDDRTG